MSILPGVISQKVFFTDEQVSSIKTKKGALADVDEASTSRALNHWDRRPCESWVHNTRLLTEDHPEFYHTELVPPVFEVMDFHGWNLSRAVNHRRFSADRIARILRDLANDADYAAYKGEWCILSFCEKLAQTITCLAPRPPLPPSMPGVATLAFETAANAIRCWYDIKASTPGLARRATHEFLRLARWGKTVLKQRPFWHVQMETGLTFTAPDWFWKAARLKLALENGAHSP